MNVILVKIRVSINAFLQECEPQLVYCAHKPCSYLCMHVRTVHFTTNYVIHTYHMHVVRPVHTYLNANITVLSNCRHALWFNQYSTTQVEWIHVLC